MLSAQKRIRRVGGGAVAIAFGLGLLGATHPAGAASPATPAATVCSVISPPGQPATDSIKLLKHGGISFGTGGLGSDHNPVCSGAMQWDIPPNTIHPWLTGKLYMNNALGKTARVSMTYYDIHGNVVTGISSPDELATSDYQEFPVTINRFQDPRFYRVDVSTEVKSGSSYVVLATKSAYIGSATHPGKSCTIDANGEEFGGSGGVSHGHPVNAASCSWAVTSSTVVAQINGTAYFENGLGRTARLLLSTYDVHGVNLGDFPMTLPSPKKNGVVSFPVFGSSASNDRIYRATLVMQLLVGTNWQQVGNMVTWYI